MHEVVGRIDVEQAEQLAARIDRGNPAERADDHKNDTENNGYLFERHFSSSMITAATWSGARRSGSRRSLKPAILPSGHFASEACPAAVKTRARVPGLLRSLAPNP